MAVRVALYSGIPVWEVTVNNVSIVRKQTDNSINLSHFFSVLGVQRQRREEFLSHYRSLGIAACWVVHGGPVRLKGTWAPFEGVKGLVGELGQQGLFAALLDEALVPDDALVAAVPPSSLIANRGVPVVLRTAHSRPSGSSNPPARPTKRPARRQTPSDSEASSSSLSSIADEHMSSDLTDLSDDDSSPRLSPRKRGLRRAPLRTSTRVSQRQVQSRKGKERETEWMDVDASRPDHPLAPNVSNTSSLEPVEGFLPVLAPELTIFQQLFGPSKAQNLAARNYLRDMRVPRLVPDDSDSEGEESVREATPRDTSSIHGIRIKAECSASSSVSQQPLQLPPVPQSPSASLEKSSLLPPPMNLGQIFDLKLKQREARLAAAAAVPTTTPVAHSASVVAQAASASRPLHLAGHHSANGQGPVAPPQGPQRPLRDAPASAFSAASNNVKFSPTSSTFPVAEVPIEKVVTTITSFRSSSPILPIVPTAEYTTAMSRCPSGLPKATH